MVSDEVYNHLISEVSQNEDNKSSHWAFHTKDFRISNSNKIRGISGFGSNGILIPFISNRIHRYTQRQVFKGIDFDWDCNYYQYAKLACSVQHRCLDVDMMRHTFTCNFLFNTQLKMFGLDRICVIGDGQTNFVSLALLSKRFKKIISINLPEVHLSDLNLISKLNPEESVKVTACNSESELERQLLDNNRRLIIITARNQSILKNKGVRLFVNIASFQEMSYRSIEDYFKTIISNNAYLYSCNREVKVLYGGERIEFIRYPWGNGEIMFSEDCPWHKEFYYLSKGIIPIKAVYDGNVIHRLVKY